MNKGLFFRNDWFIMFDLVGFDNTYYELYKIVSILHKYFQIDTLPEPSRRADLRPIPKVAPM